MQTSAGEFGYTLAMRLATLILTSAATVTLMLGACAARIEPTVTLEGGQYVGTFQAARDVLRDERFVLDRVDARAGVLSTQPNPGMLRGGDDVIDRLQRVVRVEFAPLGIVPPSADADLREALGPVVMRVRVVIERVYYPGWRPSTTSARLGSRHIDDELVKNEQQPLYAAAAREDEAYASEIAAKIMRRIAGPGEKPAVPAAAVAPVTR